MDPIEAAAEAAFARRLDPASRAPLALALSGGGDSLALLWLASAWSRRNGRPLLALTVDHRLHPNSADWTAFAGEAARRAGADWRALDWTGEKPAAGLPAAARAARHRLLAEAAREAGARVVLTGHTLDDVIEGERMRAHDAPGLGRLAEWAPSPAWPEGRGLFLLRPLLDVGREALRDGLRARGETWLDDPANDDPRFARARARAALRNRSPLAGEGGAPRDAERKRGWRVTADGRVVLSREHAADPRLLAAALLCAAGISRPPRGGELERLRTRLMEDSRVDATLAGARVVSDADGVAIGRDAGERFRGGLASFALEPASATVWDGRYEIQADEPGWSVGALGGRIGALAREERAVLKPVPAWARGALPVLVRDEVARLPRPFGRGPGQAWSLAGDRLAGACGLMAREAEIVSGHDGARALLTLCSAPSAREHAGARLRSAEGRR